MNLTIIFVIAGTMLSVRFAEGGASLVRSMGLRGSRQFVPEGNNAGGNTRLSSGAYYLGSASYDNEKASIIAKEPSPAKAQRGLGISAWGIIGIVVGVIIITSTGYYTFVFYPFICKRQQSYDMIELTNVV